MVERVEAGLRIISSLSGLAQENMTQLAGWRFLELGRRIERALADLPAGALLRFSGARGRPRRAARACRQPDHLPAALCDDRRAGAGHRPHHARSEQSPFGGFSARAHRNASRRASEAQCHGRLSPVQQIAASIATRLRTADAAAIDAALIIDIEQALMKLSDAISAAYLTSNERSDFEWEALA